MVKTVGIDRNGEKIKWDYSRMSVESIEQNNTGTVQDLRSLE